MSSIFTERQKMLQKEIREFAENELRPRMEEILVCEGFVPRDLYRAMGEHGLLGIMVSKENGGMGAGLKEIAIVTEELSKVAPVFGLMLMCVAPAIAGLQDDKAFRDAYMDRLLKGEIVYSGGITAPEGHTNAAEWGSIASRDGDDYILNGTKLFVTCSLENDLHQVFGLDETGHMRTWIIEGDAPGFVHNAPEVKFGMKGSGGGTVTYKNVRVSSDMCWDGEIGGDTTLYDRLWLMCAAIALGCMEGSFEQTVDYLKTTSDEEGQPLILSQDVAETVARLKMEILASRSFVYDAAECFDNPDTFEDGCLMCQATKVFVPESAYSVIKKCLVLQGDLGYSSVDRYHFLPDAISMMIADQTSEAVLEAIAHTMRLFDCK